MTILGCFDPPAADQNALSQNARSRSQMTFYEFITINITRHIQDIFPDLKRKQRSLQDPLLLRKQIIIFHSFFISHLFYLKTIPVLLPLLRHDQIHSESQPS